jgi:hypothetical protein
MEDEFDLLRRIEKAHTLASQLEGAAKPKSLGTDNSSSSNNNVEMKSGASAAPEVKGDGMIINLNPSPAELEKTSKIPLEPKPFVLKPQKPPKPRNTDIQTLNYRHGRWGCKDGTLNPKP